MSYCAQERNSSLSTYQLTHAVNETSNETANEAVNTDQSSPQQILEIADRVISKLENFTEGFADTIAEAGSHSLKAARLAGVNFTYDKDAQKVHTALVSHKASWMTSLSVWALFMDYRTHENSEVISPWAEVVAQVEAKRYASG